jgi:hypothetical protein
MSNAPVVGAIKPRCRCALDLTAEPLEGLVDQISGQCASGRRRTRHLLTSFTQQRGHAGELGLEHGRDDLDVLTGSAFRWAGRSAGHDLVDRGISPWRTG